MQKLFFTGLALFGLFRVIAQGPDTTSPYKLKTIKIEEINLVSSLYHQEGNNSAVTGGIGTEKLTDVAKKLAEILEAKGAPKVVVADLSRDDMAEVIEDAFRYDRLVLAAATYDAGIFPCMEDFVHHLKAKNYQKRKVAFMENGSWAPMAAKIMKGIVEGFKNIEMVDPVVTIKSTMNDENIKTMEELADNLL